MLFTPRTTTYTRHTTIPPFPPLLPLLSPLSTFSHPGGRPGPLRRSSTASSTGQKTACLFTQRCTQALTLDTHTHTCTHAHTRTHTHTHTPTHSCCTIHFLPYSSFRPSPSTSWTWASTMLCGSTASPWRTRPTS